MKTIFCIFLLAVAAFGQTLVIAPGHQEWQAGPPGIDIVQSDGQHVRLGADLIGGAGPVALQQVDASTFPGINWVARVNNAAASLVSGGLVKIPDSIAGDGSATTGSIPSNVTLQFTGSATFSFCQLNVGRYTKIYMSGAQLAINASNCIGINLTTQALFQVNDKFLLDGVRIDCQSKTNSTGIFLGAATAQAATYNVSVQNCTTVGVQYDGAQFSENYNLNVGNVTAGAGIIIHSIAGGGGNSNSFYGLKLWSNAVGCLIYADTSIGQGQNYFYNPSMLGNTVAALAVFGNASYADVHWFGGAPELNATGASSITINSKVVKKAMIYANLASVYLNDVDFEDSVANPEILAENSSTIYLQNTNSYGVAGGNLVQVDSTSSSDVIGGIANLVGQIQNVIAYPATLTNVVGVNGVRLVGAPVVLFSPDFPNGFTGNPRTPAVSSVGTGTTNSTATDATYGLVTTAIHAVSPGSTSTNEINFNNLIAAPVAATEDLFLSFLIKSSVNVGTYGTCSTTGYKVYGGGANFSDAEFCMLAGQWYRVLIYLPNQASNTNISLAGFPLGSEGPTISYTGFEALAYNAQTPQSQYFIGQASIVGMVGGNSQTLGSGGSVSAPFYAFAGQPGDGVYLVSANANVGIARQGVVKGQAANEGWEVNNLSSNATGNILYSVTAPTITGHFNTSGDSISANNGTMAFTVTVGTGTAGSTGTIGLPAATTGWNCFAANRNRGAYIQQTASATNSATLTNYGTTVGTPVNWTNSDVLGVSCFAY